MLFESTVLLLLYLHLLPDALAAEVLGFVELVCSEAACGVGWGGSGSGESGGETSELTGGSSNLLSAEKG